MIMRAACCTGSGPRRLNQSPQVHSRHILGYQVVNASVLACIESSHQIGTIEFGLHANLAAKLSRASCVAPIAATPSRR